MIVLAMSAPGFSGVNAHIVVKKYWGYAVGITA